MKNRPETYPKQLNAKKLIKKGIIAFSFVLYLITLFYALSYIDFDNLTNLQALLIGLSSFPFWFFVIPPIYDLIEKKKTIKKNKKHKKDIDFFGL